MKQLIGLLFFSLITIGTFAQDSTYAKIKEPDFPFEPVLLNSDLTTTELSREKGEVRINSKLKLLENSWVLKSPHSSFTIKQQPAKFVVKHGNVTGTFINPTSSPRDYYKLYKFDVDEKKGTRTCVYSRVITSGAGGKPTTDNASLSLPITVKKIRDDFYLLMPDKLEPGEYAIPAGENLFTFRIE